MYRGCPSQIRTGQRDARASGRRTRRRRNTRNRRRRVHRQRRAVRRRGRRCQAAGNNTVHITVHTCRCSGDRQCRRRCSAVRRYIGNIRKSSALIHLPLVPRRIGRRHGECRVRSGGNSRVARLASDRRRRVHRQCRAVRHRGRRCQAGGNNPVHIAVHACRCSSDRQRCRCCSAVWRCIGNIRKSCTCIHLPLVPRRIGRRHGESRVRSGGNSRGARLAGDRRRRVHRQRHVVRRRGRRCQSGGNNPVYIVVHPCRCSGDRQRRRSCSAIRRSIRNVRKSSALIHLPLVPRRIGRRHGESRVRSGGNSRVARLAGDRRRGRDHRAPDLDIIKGDPHISWNLGRNTHLIYVLKSGCRQPVALSKRILKPFSVVSKFTKPVELPSLYSVTVIGPPLESATKKD